jgi:hypothetical protein
MKLWRMIAAFAAIYVIVVIIISYQTPKQAKRKVAIIDEEEFRP